MNSTRTIVSALVALLFLLVSPAAVRSQDNSLNWWWSPGLGFYASKINHSVSRDLGLPLSNGLLVLAVAKSSAGGDAGLRAGDIIADWSPQELWSEAEKSGTVRIVRDGAEQRLSVTSRSMPKDVPIELIRKTPEARAVSTYVVDKLGTGNFQTITAALFRAQPGDTILIKPGTYEEAVLVPPGIKIRGTEKSLARVETKTRWLLLGNGPVELSEIVFSGAGLAIEYGEKVGISDCQFLISEKIAGLVVLDSKAVSVIRSTFRGTTGSGGISVQGSQIVISDSMFHGHGEAAITLGRKSEAEINNNLLDANAIGLLAYDSEVAAAGNIMTGVWQPDRKDERSDFGFRLERVKATLSKDVVRRHRYGIFVSEGLPTKITEGTVTQGEYGVVLIGSPASISASLIMQNMRDGIYVSAKDKEPQTQPQEVSISRNTVSTNEGNGVNVQNFSRVSVNDNLIEANGGGIILNNAVATLENNTIVLQRFSGINVNDKSNAQIFNNVVAFNSFGVFVDVTAHWQTAYNNVYGNLASTEFPLRDGNYGRSDRYTTRDGRKVPIDVYPAYDVSDKTDLSVEPGFVKLGSDYNLMPNSAISRIRGKDGRYLGAYAPPGYAARPAISPDVSIARSHSRRSNAAVSRRSNKTSQTLNNAVGSPQIKLIAIDAAEAKTLIERGDDYMKRSRWSDALAAYKQAVEISPNNAEAYNALGWAYNTMGQHGDAFAPLVKAIQLNSQLAEAHYGIGYAYLGSDNYAKAIGFLRTAVRLNPRYADARFSLGETCLELGDKKGALEQYAALKDLDTKMAQDLFEEIEDAP